MQTKKKISVTIDTKIYEILEEASKTYAIAKSQLTQEALMLWFKTRTQKMMAEGYAEMAKEDGDFVEMAVTAQRETLT